MCGILAILDQDYRPDAKLDVYNGLTSLQHRGQDGFGICCDDRAIRKSGMITDADMNDFDCFNINNKCFLGHVRYRTAGSSDPKNIQPIVIEDKIQVSLVHNGNILNMNHLLSSNEYFVNYKDYHNLGDSDTCVITTIFLYKLQSLIKQNNITQKNVVDTCYYLMDILEGSFCLCILIKNYGLIVLRDQNGIRPLVYGTKNNSHLIASESCVLQHLDFQLVRNIKVGEIAIFEYGKSIPIFFQHHTHSFTPCIFEYLYFSRPDSIVNEISVYESRIQIGRLLGKQILETIPVDDIDCIVPIPDTSNIFALGVEQVTGIPIHFGLLKNNYIKRTFIMENNNIIKQNIWRKLHAIDGVFRNKTVLFIDDSIVRGNTSKHIVKLAHQCGVKNIIFGSASPPVVNANKYGIHIPSSEGLIAHKRTNDEIADSIGVSHVIYNDLNKIIDILKLMNPNITDFEKSMFQY